MEIELVRADITQEETDAIVNAANTGLYAGAGVCGAIHAAAGPELERVCLRIPGILIDSESGKQVEESQEEAEFEGSFSDRPVYRLRCPEGNTIATEGFQLKARHVIHAVGPRWSGGEAGEEILLDRVHRSIIANADLIEAQSVSLPAISTGIFGFPLAKAAPIAIRALREAGASSQVELVRITVLDDATHNAFEQALSA